MYNHRIKFILFQFCILGFLITFLIACGTKKGVKSDLMKEEAGVTMTCNGSPDYLKNILIEVLVDYDIDIKSIEDTQERIEIVGTKGVSLKGAACMTGAYAFCGIYGCLLGGGGGEHIGILLEKIDEEKSIIKVVSKKRIKTQLFAKDWTTDILAGITAKSRYLMDIGNNEKYDIYEQDEDWLDSINKSVNTAFSFETEPTLGIQCQGRFGEYINSQLTTYIGNNNENVILVIATGEDLKSLLEQQKLQATGIFDEETAVELGELIAAKYLLVCSPYIKTKIKLVELHCKLINIESGKFLGGGIIVNFSTKELPDI